MEIGPKIDKQKRKKEKRKFRKRKEMQKLMIIKVRRLALLFFFG